MADRWELREIRIPEGTHLSRSHDTEGVERTLLRDDVTKELLGPAESRPVSWWDLPDSTRDADSPDDDVQIGFAGQMVVAVAAGITDAFVQVWNEHSEELTAVAVAFLKQKSRAVWERRPKRRGLKAEAAAEVEVDKSSYEPQASSLLKTEPTPERPQITEEQFRRYLLQVAILDEEASRMREALREVQVTDADSWPEELQETVTVFLTDGYGALDDDSRALLFDAFWGPELSAPSLEDTATPALEPVEKSLPQPR